MIANNSFSCSTLGKVELKHARPWAVFPLLLFLIFAPSAVSTPAHSDEQTSYSQAGEIEDVSYRGVKRVSSRIVVPMGRTRDELAATLDRAARELAQETQANAVMVFAYRPQDDPSGQYSYSAGRAVPPVRRLTAAPRYVEPVLPQ